MSNYIQCSNKIFMTNYVQFSNMTFMSNYIQFSDEIQQQVSAPSPIPPYQVKKCISKIPDHFIQLLHWSLFIKKTLWWPWCFLSQPNAEHISPPRSNYSVPLNGIATGYNQPFSFKFIYFSTLCMVFFPSLHCIFHPFLYCFASCDKGFRKTLNRKAASVAVSSLFWPSSTFSSTSSPLQCFQHFAETPPQYHQHFAQPPPQYH